MASNTQTAHKPAAEVVFDVIQDSGPAGISATQLGRRTQETMGRKERSAALRTLMERGHVTCFKRRGKTKPTTIYSASGEQSCGTCRFWIGGKCRRYPPVPYWPKMGADEWCGEYQAAGLGRDGK